MVYSKSPFIRKNYNHDVLVLFSGHLLKSKNNSSIISITTQIDQESKQFNPFQYILSGYLKHGLKILDFLTGEFAVAIYDIRSDNLYLVVDSFGLKQLFYYEDSNIIYFSDDIRLILKQPKVRIEVNELLLCEYLVDQLSTYDETFYRYIKKVPKGHYIKINKYNLQTIRYFNLDNSLIGELRHSNEKAIFDQFNKIFKEALIPGVFRDSSDSFGALMSGGLDSTSVVCTLLEMKTIKPLIFSAVYNSKELKNVNEKKYIQQVKQKWDIDITYVPVDDLLTLDRLECYDEVLHLGPCLDSNWLTVTHLYDLAKSSGVNNLFTGSGGDLLTGSRLCYLDLLRSGKIKNSLKYMLKDPIAFRGLLYWYIFIPLIPPWLYEIVTWLLGEGERLNIPWPNWLNQSFVIDSNLPGRINVYESFYKTRYTSTNFEMKFAFTPLSDFTSASNRVATESRHLRLVNPFFNRKVMEFIMALPPHFRFRSGIDKYILRKTMKGIVPELILNRQQKTYFNEVEILGLHKNINFVIQLFQQSKLAQRGIIKREQILKLIDSFQHGDNIIVIDLWLLISAEIWLNWIEQFQKNRRL